MLNKKKYKIILTGGGTGGGVAPLLAVAEELRSHGWEEIEFLWLGTRSGVEKEMVAAAGIKFKPILSGKFRRYWSWRNLADFFVLPLAFIQSFFIIKKERPDLIMSVGSFVSVPAVWAAWALRVPALIHQQDARPGLANRLMTPAARVITVTFKKSLDDYGHKAIWVGNPIRPEFKKFKMGRREARQKFGLLPDMPTVLIMGGGTGALAINHLVFANRPELLKFCQIIHITGLGKEENTSHGFRENGIYRAFPFLHIDGVIKAFAAADIIVSRAGLGVLTEFSYLGKPVILIPIPNSHQEENAALFAKKKAALVLNQEKLNANNFPVYIKRLLRDNNLCQELSANIKKIMSRDANGKMVEIIFKIIK